MVLTSPTRSKQTPSSSQNNEESNTPRKRTYQRKKQMENEKKESISSGQNDSQECPICNKSFPTDRIQVSKLSRCKFRKLKIQNCEINPPTWLSSLINQNVNS